MEDKDIVGLYLERDERALAETSEKYGKYCTAVAMNILSDSKDAEECVNDAYLKAWDSIPPHRPAVLSAFLGKLTRNLSLNKYKMNRSDKRGGGEMKIILDELSEIVSGSESTEDEVMRKELTKEISAFLEKLPAEKRRMFVRRYWYSDGITDIAEMFDRSENSVSVTLNRIRKKLKEYLNERGYEL